MKDYLKVYDLDLDSDGLTLYIRGNDGSHQVLLIPKRMIRRFFVLLLRALR